MGRLGYFVGCEALGVGGSITNWQKPSELFTKIKALGRNPPRHWTSDAPATFDQEQKAALIFDKSRPAS